MPGAVSDSERSLKAEIPVHKSLTFKIRREEVVDVHTADIVDMRLTWSSRPCAFPVLWAAAANQTVTYTTSGDTSLTRLSCILVLYFWFVLGNFQPLLTHYQLLRLDHFTVTDVLAMK